MPLSDAQRQLVRGFRDALETALADDARFRDATREDRPDESTLATRWQAADRVWFEIALRPLIPQVRVAVLTDDRWRSEDWEEKIEESGDSMNEFIGMGMHDAGLDWEEPPVEHYRADLKYFYFTTPLELSRLDDLADPATRDRIRRMFDGYYNAFSEHLGGE